MVRNPYFWRAFLLSVLAFAILCAILLRIPAVHRSAELFSCRFLSADSAREECVFSVIGDELKTTTTGDALKLFVRALSILPRSNTGCHDYAHRVGDIAYYNLYVFNPDSVAFTHPPESAVCDYGFYHGFYEHYFQEHPGVSSIVDTCSALPSGPEPYRRVIRQTCFHGAGHGLVLGRVDKLTRRDWGDIHAFADVPLATCSQLSGLKPDEFERCPLGVFAMIAQWRLLENYGFSFSDPPSERFKDCLTFKTDYRNACIFTNAIVAQSTFEMENTFTSCEVLKDQSAFVSCIKGIILGLFINGADEARLNKGLSFCASTGVANRDATHDCYLILEWGLAAYFPEAQQEPLCKLFPQYYSDRKCLATEIEVSRAGLGGH